MIRVIEMALAEKTGKGLDVNSIFASNEYDSKSNDNNLCLKIPIDEAIRIFKQRGFDVKKQENTWEVSKGSILLSMYDVKGGKIFSPWGVEVVVSSETGEFVYGESQTQRYTVSFNVDWNYTESELSNTIKDALNSLKIEYDSFNVTERKYESKKRSRKTEAFNQPYSDNTEVSFKSENIDGEIREWNTTVKKLVDEWQYGLDVPANDDPVWDICIDGYYVELAPKKEAWFEDLLTYFIVLHYSTSSCNIW